MTRAESNNSLPTPMQNWLRHLHDSKRYSSHTLDAYQRDLKHLARIHEGVPLETLTENHIRTALTTLHREQLQARSLARALAAWRGFFQWWGPQVNLSHNPAAAIRAPKAPQNLPKALSVEQAQQLLDRPGLPPAQTAVEFRDQAMFEVLYSSGLRLSELIGLDTHYIKQANHTSSGWLELDEAQLTVYGKGRKTRVVPLGRLAQEAVKQWLKHRPAFAQHHLNDADAQAALFLGVRGKRISARVVQKQLQELSVKANLPVHVHPHGLRHSFASHLLQSAHDLRAVQELLGHANISTTQIYTRLDYQHLASVYDQAHPRARRQKG